MKMRLLCLFLFISASISAQVPEAPGTELFNSSTMLQELDVHPADELTLIDLPVANQKGSANLSFPIKLPPGRNGMEPSVEVMYNSESGNGWCGIGWDVYIPSIKVETRWGVPRYSSTEETETYLYQNMQLAPVSHRSALQSRESEKRFFPRVENGFSKIVRHGTSPKNYWWEVTDTEGTRNFYGGLPGIGVINSAVLKDDRGNIAHWHIVETRNLNNNFVRYESVIVNDVGIPGGSVQGVQIYPRKITYTGFGEEEGAFSVLFVRDRDLGETKRKDVSIVASLGLKEVTADLLRKIEVRYQDEMVRSYDLKYAEGAFFKTLLTSIAEYDADGELFYQHEFEYYDEVRQNGNYQPFLATDNWQVPADQINGGLLTANPLFPDNATLLGSGMSREVSGGGAVTVGPLGNPVALTNTAGPNFNYGEGNGNGLSAFVDLNGDGLPDKVFKENGRLYYRSNQLKADGTKSFGPKIAIGGSLKDFSISKTTNISIGAEGHPGPVFLGYNYTESDTRVSTYFSDFNGDGLIDIVHSGKVHFNYLDENGVPTFTTNSGLTPNPIVIGEAPDPSLFEIDPEQLDKDIDMFPLHDVVRMWEAPYTGSIEIDAPVRLIEDLSTASQTYVKKDGVRVAIQIGNFEIWSTEIDPDDFSAKSPASPIVFPISKGDRIYFRVGSVFDGAFDQVEWDPIITYTNFDITEIDAHEKPTHVFQASEDFITASSQVITMSESGMIQIDGQLNKPITSDTLRFSIYRVAGFNFEVLNELKIPWDSTYQDTWLTDSVRVDSSDRLLFVVNSKTNVDWSSIDWDPGIVYIERDNGNDVLDAEGNPILSFCPAPDFKMYNDIVEKGAPYIAPGNGIYQFTPITQGPIGLEGNLTFSVKGPNRLYGQSEVELIDGTPVNNDPISADLMTGDTVFIEYHTQDSTVAADLNLIQVQISGASTATRNIALYTPIDESKEIFGSLYRGWGQFTYNGNRGRATEPINQSELRLPEIEVDDDIAEGDIDEENIDIDYDYSAEPFILMIADHKTKTWLGSDNLTYLGSDFQSSSRLGKDDLLPDVITPDGEVVSAPALTSKATMNSIAIGAAAGAISGSFGYSEASTLNTLDVLDFNGDGYPDIASRNTIQFTNALGGLEETVVHNLGGHEAGSYATGIATGGSYVESSASTTGHSSRPYVSKQARGGNKAKSTRKSGRTLRNQKSRASRGKTKANQSSNKADDGQDASQASVGISANIGWDRDSVVQTWLDVNGDGLADLVSRGGNVRLNLGYRFAAAERWNFTSVRAGGNRDLGGGLGVNLFNGSTSFGTSIATSEMIADIGMLDVNSDGLADQIVSIEPLRVRLNLGTRFSDPITWSGIDYFENGEATGESINGAFTVCIPIVFVRVCINPSTSAGRGVSRQLKELNDVNGDGFLDYVESDNDGDLKTRTSAIGRTNLLKTIKRPLGAEIEISYAPEGNTFDLPSAMWAMESVEIYDGVEGDGVDRMKVAFDYENGQYNRREREFYGFTTIRSHELDTEENDRIIRTTESEYYTEDFYRKGFLKEQRVFDGNGNIYSRHRNTYDLIDVLTGTMLPQLFIANDFGSAFPALSRTEKWLYEGDENQALYTSTTFEYDSYGNKTSVRDIGNGNPEDAMYTKYAYFDDDDVYLKSIASSVIDSIEGGVVRKRTMEIDPSGDYIQINQHLNSNEIATLDMEYDVYGNLTLIQQPENANGERVFQSYEYDDELHTYQVLTADAYGYTSTSTYDPRFGYPLNRTDINGNELQYTLDNRGRITSVKGPYEIENGNEYAVKFEYQTDAPVSYAISHQYDPEHEQDITKYVFVDGRGRIIQRKIPGVTSSGNTIGSLQMIVSGIEEYDALGRITASYYPTVEPIGASNTQFQSVKDPINPIVIKYDILGRPIETTLPDGAVSYNEYFIGSDNLGERLKVSLATDALGNVSASYSDVRGRRKAISQLGPNGNIWTNFDYNGISEMIASYDHEGNVTEYLYDNFGRRATTKHPDSGVKNMMYDLSGNLISEQTQNLNDQIPNGGEIRYTYELDRLVQIDYPKNVQNRVQIHYGDQEAKYNRRGRAWLQEDASGGEEFFYGPLGETEKQVRTVMVNQANVRTYVTEFEFDTWNRLQKIIYPDGEVADYGYNQSGRLLNLTTKKQNIPYEIVKSIGYDKFNDKRFANYGNGTGVEYQYETERRRLGQMQINLPGGQTLMDCFYTYDAEDNIISLENRASKVEGQLGGNASHIYTYDEIYRLSTAKGEWSGQSKQSYSSKMEYDDLHNVKRKAQEHLVDTSMYELNSFDYDFTYDGMQPHAPSDVAGRELSFDGNGNMVASQSNRAFSFSNSLWDEENRLMGHSRNGYITQYTYDAHGERVIKSHGGISGVFVNGAPAGMIDHRANYEVYVNSYFTMEKDRFVKHYYLGDQRVAAKIGTGKFENYYWPNRGLTAGNLDYIKRMQLIEQSQYDYFAQLGVPPGPPTLPGYYAQPELTGNPLPGTTNHNYSNPPVNWPKQIVFSDPSGPPGPPVQFGQPDSLNEMKAGFGFVGVDVFAEENEHFYYHANHLNSTNYVTDYNGNVRQYTEYFPSGEIFVQEEKTEHELNYLFNGKYFDKEAGIYYYGARYYDPKLSLWASVDPLAESFPSWSPYNYTMHNPVKFIDPDGKAPGEYRSVDAAAKAFAMKYNVASINENREYGAQIYEHYDRRRNKSYFSYGPVFKGGKKHLNIPPPSAKVVADIHTHGAWMKGLDSEVFSGQDMKMNRIDQTIGYVATPEGRLLKYDPKRDKKSIVSENIPFDGLVYGVEDGSKTNRKKGFRKAKIHRSPGAVSEQLEPFFGNTAAQPEDIPEKRPNIKKKKKRKHRRKR